MCKTLLTIVLFFSFSFIASAQFNKGDVLLGGQLSYNTTKNNFVSIPIQKINSGNFTVSTGLAVSSNSVFGINLSYMPSSQSNNPSNSGYYDYKNTGYSAGLFYRMYKTLGKEFYLYGEAGFNYIGSRSSTKDITGSENSTGSTNGGNLYIMPGVAYRISKKFFLELSIPNLFTANYNSAKSTASGTTTSQDYFSVGANLSSNTLSNLGIGFRLVL